MRSGQVVEPVSDTGEMRGLKSTTTEKKKIDHRPMIWIHSFDHMRNELTFRIFQSSRIIYSILRTCVTSKIQSDSRNMH